MKHSLKSASLAICLMPLAAYGFQDAPAAAPVQTEAAKPAQAPAPAPQSAKPAVTTSGPQKGGTPPNRANPGMPGMGMPGMPPGMGGPQKPQKPAWKQFNLNTKTTMFLDFTDSNPDMVISLFSRTSGITILKDPQFKSTLTVTSAAPVHLGEAFEILNTVLGMQGFELQKRGNLMIVGKIQPPPQIRMPEPPQPQPVTKVYPLVNADATQVAKVITDLYGGQGGAQSQPNPGMMQFGGGPPGIQFNMGGRPGMSMGMPSGGGPGGDQKSVKVSAEDYSNSIIVIAVPAMQDELKVLIDQLDRKSAELPLDSEIFRLKYIAADDAVQAIMDVLSANLPSGRGRSKTQDQNQGQNFFFRGSNEPKKTGGQTAIAVKQTNSIIVSATKENMEVIRKLISDMDRESAYIGTTFVIHLENSKATDVATLLNQAFSKPRGNGQDNPFQVFVFDSGPTDKKTLEVTKDLGEDGVLVNVRDLTGQVNVTADPNTNSLIVVTMPSNMKLVRGVVEKIDRMAEQVMIETIIVEANLDKTTKLGVEWNFLQGKVLGNPNVSSGTSTDFAVKTGLAAPTPSPEPKGFQYTLTGPGYSALVNAMQTDSRFKVLSTPRIFTSNNVKAEINVSQQVPYITSQQSAVAGGTNGSLISNYDFKNVGVVLTVTPRITSNGQVAMDVVQSADDLQGFTSFNAPIINHRQASTTVSVKDGETIVLGGIIRQSINLTENKVPLLGDIPLFGNLFKSSNREAVQTELMVLLTPHIVKDSVAAQLLRKQETERLSKESQKSLEHALPPTPKTP